MAYIVSVANEKGGVGKSTLSINLAWGLAEAGLKVLVVDCDAQRSVSTWYEETDTQKPFDIEPLEMKNFHKVIGSLSAGYDVVVADTPGHLQVGLGSLLKGSNMALVTFRPSPLDLYATVDVANLVENWAVSSNGERHAYFVPMGMRKGTKTAKMLLPVIERDYELPILNGCGLREAYIWPLVMGGCVYTSGEKEAVNEMNEIVDLVKANMEAA